MRPRTKTRKRRARRQSGGAAVDIQKKPIVVVFSHGGCELENLCEPSGTYELEKNTQLMILSHPGESLAVTSIVKKLLDTNALRYHTLEPLFDLHSISDLTKKNASYLNLETNELTPFHNEGKSIFESPLRAKEGSTVPNSLFTFERTEHGLLPNFGVYLYAPEALDGVHYIPVPLIKKNATSFHLSDLFTFLAKNKYSTPEIGVGVVLLSCNTFYKDYIYARQKKFFLEKGNLQRNKTIAEKCYAIEDLYQKANTEYNELDLLGSQKLAKKYPIIHLPILSSRRAKTEPPEVLEMMKMANTHFNETI